MTQIYNTISDPMYLKQLINGYESEEIDQWLLYLWDWGWSTYYSSMSNTYGKSDEELNNSDFLDFSKKSFKKDEKTVFISLWCWNSETEKYIMNNLGEEYNIDYIWVDTSPEMINMSVENLKDIKNNTKFLRADFGSDEFKNEINNLCKNYDRKIFAFFGGTFGNIKYTKIINILYNILDKNDKIWIDIGIRKWTKIEDDLALFERYKTYLTDPQEKRFLLNKIINDGIKEEDGEIILESTEHPESKALQFSFYFKFNKKININIKNYNIVFLPGYSIKLIQIYRFGVDGFIKLLEGHNFNLLEKQTKWYDGQFLFESNKTNNTNIQKTYS